MHILIYCPAAHARAAIARHLVDVGSHRLFFAETEPLVVSIALDNEIKLAILHDPENIRSIINLKDFLREKRRSMRVRIVPGRNGVLSEGWQDVINQALKPVKPRTTAMLGSHLRFTWKPTN